MRAAVSETVQGHERDQAREQVAAQTLLAPFPRLGAGGGFSGARRDGVAVAAGANGSGAQPAGVGEQDAEWDGDRFQIKEDACFVMARACELFVMDVAKRSELAMEDTKRRFFLESPAICTRGFSRDKAAGTHR